MPEIRFITYNGKIVPADQPIFGPDNRSFRYGDGLFESLRMVDGHLKHLPLHAKRLKEGMQALKMNGSPPDETFLETEIKALARSNKLYKDARIRVSVFRQDGGLYIPEANGYHYLIELFEMPGKGYELNKTGLIIGLYEEVRKNPGLLANFKTNNSLPYVLAGIHRNEQQVDECLLLNEAGNLVEAISSNVFLVKNNTLFTPSLSEGCIAGVMRTVTIGLAKANGIDVQETALSPALLPEADELFLSNAAIGIRWVGGYRNKRYFAKLSKELNSLLNK